jgi:hypothetical protein
MALAGMRKGWESNASTKEWCASTSEGCGTASGYLQMYTASEPM